MHSENAPCVRIKNFQYASYHSTRPRLQADRNPIRIVVDKMGADGLLHQQIVNQSDELEREARESESKQPTPPTRHYNSLSLSTLRPPPLRVEMGRSHIFNRFHYDNYQQLPAEKPGRSIKARPSRSNQKNIEVVFCESKFPEFVERTNHKIEGIFRREQLQAHEESRKFIAAHATKDRLLPSRRPHRTTLAACLKEFGTLEKLSVFMESDQNLRERCLHFGVERDPSRTLLLDVLNHRFAFMKQLGKRLRDRIYSCLFRRDDLHALAKINVQQYMNFYEMFVGRDASVVDTAAFIYLLLFADSPSFAAGKHIIEQTHGPIHKQRTALQVLFSLFDQQQEDLVTNIAKNEAFMRLVIDLIVEK